MNIGKSLKLALLESGLNQLECADKIGINPTLLNRHFNSKLISMSLVARYADFFKIKPSELIALSE